MDGFESLIAAWTIWSEGKEVDKELIIWGKSLRWWDRAGQLAQIWGAFVLVVEVIGRERFLRLESWAMRVLAPWNAPYYKGFVRLWIPLAMPVARLIDWLNRRQRQPVTFRKFLLVMLTILLFCFALATIATTLRFVYGPEAARTFTSAVVLIFMMPVIFMEFVLAYTQVLAMISITVTMLTLAVFLAAMAISQLFAHPKMGVALKLISIVVVIAGTHFTVLAS